MKNDRGAPETETDFTLQVAAKAARKLKLQREGKTGVWYGLGMTGLIGWSVVVPTLLGAMLGWWRARHHPGGHSWTLALLVAGLVIGCANAWHWVSREDRAMHEHRRPTVSEPFTLVPALLAGFVLGACFFGGLWWTVRKSVASAQPALWILGSLLLRTGLTLAGFWWVSHGDWRRLLACLLGFLLARIVVVRLTRVTVDRHNTLNFGRRTMNLSSDQQILWQHGFIKLNATIVTTWALMIVLALGAKLITRRLVTAGAISRWQAALEIVVTGISKQIGEVGLRQPEKYLAFLGTLFLFVATASLCTLIPGYLPPTGSLSTTAALALCVFVAVPYFGIREQGLARYLKTYTEPTPIMLPFNIISELSRTLALAVRLFGNMMSGAMIIAILLTITPFLFPIVMTALGLLTGMVQAYIFSILAAVYIAAATVARKSRPAPQVTAAPGD